MLSEMLHGPAEGGEQEPAAEDEVPFAFVSYERTPPRQKPGTRHNCAL